MSDLQEAKLWLIGHVHLARDALHIYVALFVLFGSLLVFRWRITQWKPWLLVLAVALIGEAWDIRDEILYQHGAIYWAGSWKDIWNTMFWPTALLLLARYTPVFGRR